MSHRLQVLIPEELDSKLTKAATRSRISKGEWVRQVLEAAIRQTAVATDPLSELASMNAPTGDIDCMLAEIDQGRN
ncbi:MAG: hypothetical protein JWN34_2378 [Bryobacterales bacterium]|jgi:ABC-type cobalamin transport system ATPase subunit|nr:hypothetical protein [Bryobacterales bacterium]